jgi:hypothetical protein
MIFKKARGAAIRGLHRTAFRRSIVVNLSRSLIGSDRTRTRSGFNLLFCRVFFTRTGIPLRLKTL